MAKIQELSDANLIAEWRSWDLKIASARSWGAALAAAGEFRDECEKEIRLRKLHIPELET